MQSKQRWASRKLPLYLDRNQGWCQAMRQQIGQAETPAELAMLRSSKIDPHLRRSVPAILGSAQQASDYTTRLRRDLEALVGPDDADALVSNLSGEADLLASLGPLVGLARVAHREMDKDSYLEHYGHRGPDEFELSVPRPAEDPEWLRSQVEGPVRRLERLEDGEELRPGKILVTAQTNIGWTFLFPRTASIITDVGAPLSHAAIVARELGIPAVVGCGNATQWMATGDWVRLDGGRGTVEILKRVDPRAIV